MTYTADAIRAAIEADRERLFSLYAIGRPDGWTCDQRTKDFVCISVWMREELTRIGIDDLGRRTQENAFYRFTRQDEDMFTLAAEIMNDAVEGRIDRDRRPHRRWG